MITSLSDDSKYESFNLIYKIIQITLEKLVLIWGDIIVKVIVIIVIGHIKPPHFYYF